MEITLISVATLLLLLAGNPASSQLSEKSDVSPALFQQLLERYITAQSFATGAQPSAMYRCAPLGVQAHRRATLVYESQLTTTQALTASSPAGHRHKQYRTRFGFADGAYRALGPPLAYP